MKTTDNNDEVNEHHKGGIEKETRARVVKLIRAKTLNWIKEKKKYPSFTRREKSVRQGFFLRARQP